MRDFWVDGHYIAATNEDEARSEAAALYEFTPKVVREWTSEDQAALDWNDDADRFGTDYVFVTINSLNTDEYTDFTLSPGQVRAMFKALANFQEEE